MSCTVQLSRPNVGINIVTVSKEVNKSVSKSVSQSVSK